MADEDKDSKTEDPTGNRLNQSRQKGQVANSREVPTALLFLAALSLFIYRGEELWLALMAKMRFFLSGQIGGELTPNGVALLFEQIIYSSLRDLAPFFVVFVLVAFVSSVMQHGWLFSLGPLAPSLSKLNPLAGIKRLFSMRSVVELFKSILKMTVVGFAVYLGIKDSGERVLALTATSVVDVIVMMGNDVIAVLWRVAIAFIIMAIIDFYYQKYEHIKGLRMTKQEVKDEMKQMDGDPLIKGRIRQLQREMAQKRMMQEVPEADVVITNPTHFSVALVYVQGEMPSPKLVAKGRGVLAARIRDLATENGVPLVENPPLARTLYRDVEVEQNVPPDLFKAVAEVLAYVYGLRRRHPAPRRVL
ncbi:MAG: flagellar biosynthesis protein FlhB [Magnetococcales bacterium]|nr:flagellar biosynthesis protein FlhB [Magnetococcales bacterium]